MIKTFKDSNTEKIFHGKQVKKLPSALTKKARRRLEIKEAIQLVMLYQYKQWRVTFEWNEGKACDVFFEDYHS